ncbi:MAG: hypothetical protein IT327_15715 [Anaerolineae bacterium]|nr:hypothetical protein [Anaerolineae bacterium]
MNQKKFAVWIIAIFLLTACAGFTTAGSVAQRQMLPSLSCPEFVEIQGDNSLAPGETASLVVSPTSYGWQYQWTAPDMSLLSAPQKSITDFTAPASGGEVEVTVAVTSHQECEVVTASINISIASPSTITPSATDTIPPTSMPTQTVARTQSPTITPSATKTSTPTVILTSTPYPTPLPSHTPTATVPAFAILLQEPKNDTCVGTENAIFQWLATRPLNNIEGANGEYFALNIWAEGSPVYSVSWIKNPRYEIENISDPIAVYTQLVNCSGENGCFWNVDLIVSKVDKGSGHLPESFTKLYSSPQRWFCTEVASPPIPPTNTPEPPILATPNDESCPPDC